MESRTEIESEKFVEKLFKNLPGSWSPKDITALKQAVDFSRSAADLRLKNAQRVSSPSSPARATVITRLQNLAEKKLGYTGPEISLSTSLRTNTAQKIIAEYLSLRAVEDLAILAPNIRINRPVMQPSPLLKTPAKPDKSNELETASPQRFSWLRQRVKNLTETMGQVRESIANIFNPRTITLAGGTAVAAFSLSASTEVPHSPTPTVRAPHITVTIADRSTPPLLLKLDIGNPAPAHKPSARPSARPSAPVAAFSDASGGEIKTFDPATFRPDLKTLESACANIKTDVPDGVCAGILALK